MLRKKNGWKKNKTKLRIYSLNQTKMNFKNVLLNHKLLRIVKLIKTRVFINRSLFKVTYKGSKRLEKKSKNEIYILKVINTILIRIKQLKRKVISMKQKT